ncbi:MAG: hypothetical protein RMK75_04995 [Aquificaceae bacterium]|nr:hypothetical protein [Aquificaceae bacterium]MDW8423663.1 hypothetical protein [Aquificaceae bacterium]
MLEDKKILGMKPDELAFSGTIILPLGGFHYAFGLLGGLLLLLGVWSLLDRHSLGELKKTFGVGLLMAILGGFWARYVLDSYGFEIKRLLLTALISGLGLYLQARVYATLSRVEKKELLELGGILLVVGSATFWFFIGFLPLALGVLLIAYSFWRW